MYKSRGKWLIIGIILIGIITMHAQDTLHLEPSFCATDTELGLVLCNSPLAEVNIQNTTATVISIGQDYQLVTPESDFELGKAYALEDDIGDVLVLYFTELPIVSIQASDLIVDEPRIYAELNLQASSGEHIQSAIGIEHKGGWTQTLAKKSFRVELWSDSLGMDTEKLSLLDMRSDDDWNLEAMFNEPLRIRNVTNGRLWNAIHEPYYLDEEPEAKAGIEFRYVELLLDGQYQGVYALSERIDRKLLKLKKFDENRRGELFKAYSWGASTFGSLPPFDNSSHLWGGFEHIYPEQIIEWEALHGFIDFGMNEEEEVFYQDWTERFDQSNAIDYFIFLNVIRALDNTGKNIYVARYDAEEPYFYVPFDLDGTYGIAWDGSRDEVTDDILSNGFFDRLLNGCSSDSFNRGLEERWLSLRQTILSNAMLKEGLQNIHAFLATNGIYEREEMVWPSYEYRPEGLVAMENWIDERMAFLDNYFQLLCNETRVDNLVVSNLTLKNNISSGLFLFESKAGIEDFSVSVYDGLGQLHYTRTNDLIIDLSSSPAGCYFLTVAESERMAHYKILVVE